MEWPWQYNFPPFYTLQPNEDTKKKQIDAWCDLVLQYCKENRIYQLDLVESQMNELFNNKKIDRKCSIELITAIITELINRGRAEWFNEASKSPKKTANRTDKCIILWHSLGEWAKLIYDYVNKNSLQNTVCTFYELTESKEVRNEKFYKINNVIFRKALHILEDQHKAEVFQLDSESELGVKFF